MAHFAGMVAHFCRNIHHTIDDDNNPDSNGNGNAICEPNETIESLPYLQNDSEYSANIVSGGFYNHYEVPNINVWNNKAGVSGTVVNKSFWNYAFNKPQPIIAGAKDMVPQWDFVFDYNLANTHHFFIGLGMSGRFQLFKDYQSYFRWLVPIEYNKGYSAFNTAVNSPDYKNVSIFPNPAASIVNVDLGDASDAQMITIYNVMGQKLVDKKIITNQFSLDVSTYPEGMYVIKVSSQKGQPISLGWFLKK